jgi:hypothetical protein
MVLLTCRNIDLYENNLQKTQFDCNKIILPQSLLYQILFDINENVCFPIFFKVTNYTTNLFTYCSGSEFDAEENTCYLSSFVQSKLGIIENDSVEVDFIDNSFDSIPKGIKVILQPFNEDLYDVPIEEIKPRLEKVFVEYIIVNKYDVVILDYEGKKIYLEVNECFPKDHICVLDTDLEIDFKEAKEKKPKIFSTQNNSSEPSGLSVGQSIGQSSGPSSLLPGQLRNNTQTQSKETKKFIPFSGQGHTLGKN